MITHANLPLILEKISQQAMERSWTERYTLGMLNERVGFSWYKLVF